MYDPITILSIPSMPPTPLSSTLQWTLCDTRFSLFSFFSLSSTPCSTFTLSLFLMSLGFLFFHFVFHLCSHPILLLTLFFLFLLWFSFARLRLFLLISSKQQLDFHSKHIVKERKKGLSPPKPRREKKEKLGTPSDALWHLPYNTPTKTCSLHLPDPPVPIPPS